MAISQQPISVLLCIFFLTLSPSYSHRVVNKGTDAVGHGDNCTAGKKFSGHGTTLRLVHAHGPCTNTTKHAPTMIEKLFNEQARLKNIAARLKDSAALKINTYSASIFESFSSGFVVLVGVGTPPVQLYLDINTGGDLTWIQCQPCRNCFSQRGDIFDPQKSTTYRSIPCGSSSCISENDNVGCSGGNCTYSIVYGDDSFSNGTMSEDVYTLNNAKLRFIFGCGDDNEGVLSDYAGLLGLGRGPVSILSQNPSVFNNFFSYCLPSSTANAGFLSFGGDSRNYTFVPFSPYFFSTYYSFDLTNIKVGNTSLPMEPIPMMIETGTAVTYLPREIYTSMKDLYVKSMSGFRRVSNSTSLFDTCYDLSGNSNALPIIEFQSNDQLTLSLSANNFIAMEKKESCFAYRPSDDFYGVFGSNQQMSFEIAIDLDGRRVGFGDAHVC